MQEKQEGKKPLGILFLGGFNFVVLGVLSLGFFFLAYKDPTSEASKALLAEFSKYIPGQTLTPEQFKAVLLSQIFLAGVFLVSGWGILSRREWGRRLTLYFSFSMVILAAVSVLFQSSLINSALLQIIYPGILILYFTNKKIESYFVPAKNGGIEVAER